jgi:hypothetical protein
VVSRRRGRCCCRGGRSPSSSRRRRSRLSVRGWPWSPMGCGRSTGWGWATSCVPAGRPRGDPHRVGALAAAHQDRGAEAPLRASHVRVAPRRSSPDAHRLGRGCPATHRPRGAGRELGRPSGDRDLPDHRRPGRNSADLVLAADGVHSRLRSQLFPDHPGLSYAGYITWRGVVPASAARGSSRRRSSPRRGGVGNASV